MPSIRERLIAAATAFVDALIAALPAAPAPDPTPTPSPGPTPTPTPPPTPAPLPTSTPTAHPIVALGSQGARLKAAIGSPAGVRWRRAVDNWLGGANLWGFSAWNGALAYQLTGDQRYAVKAVAQIDAQVTAAEAKIAGGAAPGVAGDSYLQVGEMIGDLALVLDWCYPLLTAAQRTRWIAYANQSVWNVWNHASASWGIANGIVGPGKAFAWSGWSVDDPGDNYFYSFLRATMLLGLATKGENAQAQTWLDKFRERTVGRLIPFMSLEQPDGGSREGTGYGVALRNLFDLYALWAWTTGERIADLTTHTRASMATLASQIVPTLDHKAPIGDQSRDSTAALFDYERAYLLELLSLYPTAPEAPAVAGLLAASTVSSMQNSFMLAWDLVYGGAVGPGPINLPITRYTRGIGEICARTDWGPAATWLSMICGPLTQSHAHEDQGSLLLHRGGWLVGDAVLWSKGGVRQASSPVGSTAAHSLVRIDLAGQPVPQRDSPTAGKLLALHAGAGYVFASMDLTGAYGGNPAVQSVRRQVLWLKPDVVLVQDRIACSALATLTWQLVVPTLPAIVGAMASVTAGARVLRVTRISPSDGVWSVFRFDGHPDFTGGFRLDQVRQVQPGVEQTFVTALSIDSVALPPAVTWADVGCTFSIGGQQVTLGAGVDAL